MYYTEQILNSLSNFGGKASCKQLSDAYGYSYNSLRKSLLNMVECGLLEKNGWFYTLNTSN